MNYTIMDKIPTEVVDGVMHYLVVIFCDTDAKIPEPDPTWDAGSMCIIGVGHGVKFLTSEGAWV